MVTPMSKRGRHTRKLFWGTVSAALFLFIAAAVATPFLLNSEYAKNRISTAVRSGTGLDVDFSEVSISFFPGFHISFSDIRTRADDSQSGTIDKLGVYPEVSSLLKGRLIVTKVVLEGFETGELIDRFNPEKLLSRQSVFPLLIRDAVFQIESYIQGKNGIEIVLENLNTRYFTGVDASFRIRRVKESITGKVLLKGLEVKGESFQSFIPGNRVLPSATTDTTGIRFTIDKNGLMTGDCEFRNLVLHPAGGSGLTLDLEELTAAFDISPTKSEIRVNSASLEPVLQKPEISFNRMAAPSFTTLKFSAEKVNIDSAETFSKAFIGDNIVSRNIFSIIESGVCPKIEVAFQNHRESGLLDPKNLIIKGTLRSGTVNIPDSGLTAQNVSGSAFMKDDTLDLEVDKGNIENSEIHQGTVSVELLSGPDVPFTSRFSLTADLRQVPAILSRLVDNEAFAGEMKRVSVSKGSALVDLFLDKKSEKDLTVEVAAKDVRLEGWYDRMHDRIKIFDGSFFYKNKTARIDHVTARSGGSYLYDVCTEFRLSPEPTADIRSGKALFQIKEIFPYLKSAGAFPAGSIPFSAQSGTIWIESLNMALPFQKKGKQDLRITGKAKDIQTVSGPGKEADCVLSFDFTVSGERMSISGLTGRVEDIRPVFELSGSPFVRGIKLPFSIINGTMEMDSSELFFTGKLDFSSGPAVELTVRRNGRSDFALEHLSITDRPATRFDFQDTGENAVFSGILSSSTLEKLFTKHFLSGTGFLQTTGENHFVISSDKKSFLELDAYHMDLSSVLNQKNKYTELRKWLNDKTIRVKTRSLDAGRYRLDKVTALLDIKPDKAVIQLLNANLCGIDINGTIVNKGDFLEYRADTASKENDDLRQTAECLFNGETLIDGSYFFQGRFHSKSPKDRLKETVSGSFELFASNGRIYRLTLLSRILSVINVSKVLKGRMPDILQNGFAYHTMSLKADVKDSRIVIKEGIIDGTDMSLIFTGDVYPVQRKIDLTFLVAPFKTVDMIVKNIPVLNTLLGGKLVSIPVKAEGTMKNPTVIPLHPSAVGTGLTNMMKNIVNTPVKLMEKLP